MSFRIRTSITDTAVAAPGMNPEATVAAGDSTCFYKTTRTGTDDDEGIRRKIVHTDWYWYWGATIATMLVVRSSRFSKVLNVEQTAKRNDHFRQRTAVFKTKRRRHQLLAIPTSNCASNGLFGGGQKSRSPPPLEKSNRFSPRPMPD